jgi:DNA-binding XRE family transcriptional regulator
MKDAHERLRQARTIAGFPTATAAAKRFHWSEPTYLSHENGSRGYPKLKAINYAKAFKVSLEWLLSGRGEMRADITVPLKGYIGAGGLIMPVDDHAGGAGLEQVDAPPEMGPDTVAVQVRGTSQWPAYGDGDLIYYDTHHESPMLAVGSMSIVMLKTGEMMLKMVQLSRKNGHFTLISINAPPIEDVELEWAAPVRWIKKK